MILAASPTANIVPHSGAQSAGLKSVPLLVSLTVYQLKWSKGVYSCFSLLSSQKSSWTRKEKQSTGTDTKVVLLPIAYVSVPLWGCEASFHLPKNRSKTKVNRKCSLGICGMSLLDADWVQTILWEVTHVKEESSVAWCGHPHAVE